MMLPDQYFPLVHRPVQTTGTSLRSAFDNPGSGAGAPIGKRARITGISQDLMDATNRGQQPLHLLAFAARLGLG